MKDLHFEWWYDVKDICIECRTERAPYGFALCDTCFTKIGIDIATALNRCSICNTAPARQDSVACDTCLNEHWPTFS